MTNEARRAAEATKQQTDPDQYAEYAVDVIDERLEARLQTISQTASDLLRASNYTREVLGKAEQNRTDAERRFWEREQKLDRFKRRLPWFGLSFLVLTLALSLTLPRFLASNAALCGVLGASWTTTSTGANACVFYQQ